MKKVVGIFTSILMCIIGLFTLSGCDFINDIIRAKTSPPNSIEIDGEEYVTGFYDNLFVIGVEYREGDTCEFTMSPYQWWHMEDGVFDMYFCQHEDAMIWHPTLYCKKEQFEEVKNYYSNPENYDYFIGRSFEEPIQLPDDLDRTKAENVISLILTNESYRNKTLTRVTYKITINDYKRFVFFKQSKDGLFETANEDIIYYQKNIYLMIYEDGAKDVTHLFIPPDEFSEYLSGLLKEYNLFDFN